MEENIINYFDLSEKDMNDTIAYYLASYSNDEGIDLSKIYLTYLSYYFNPSDKKTIFEQFFGVNCPINTKNDHVKGFISLIPDIRKGTTAYKYVSLKQILDIDRISYSDLEIIFENISNIDANELIHLPDYEIAGIMLDRTSIISK